MLLIFPRKISIMSKNAFSARQTLYSKIKLRPIKENVILLHSVKTLTRFFGFDG